jgi:hypothetical protein
VGERQKTLIALAAAGPILDSILASVEAGLPGRYPLGTTEHQQTVVSAISESAICSESAAKLLLQIETLVPSGGRGRSSFRPVASPRSARAVSVEAPQPVPLRPLA